ncbi:hypothetical protein HDU98_000586 [Podochytrium sp. JEL0797]|nr:hypothetical protein HDU98_000586 [Podochytrium sp. JEL0797]
MAGAPPSYSAASAPPLGLHDASVTPLPSPPSLPPHPLDSSLFVRSSVQSHVRNSFFAPFLADALIDMEPARACSVVALEGSIAVAVDSLKTTEERRIVNKTNQEPNTPSRYSRIGSGSHVFSGRFASLFPKSFVVSASTAAQLFGVPIPSSAIASHYKPLKWPPANLVSHEQDHSLGVIDNAKFAVGETDFVIPDTTVVEKCGNCVGDGYKPCSDCKSTGKMLCRTCDGDGVVTVVENGLAQNKNGEEVVTKTRRIVKDASGVREVQEETVTSTKTSPRTAGRHTTTDSCSKCKGTGRSKCASCHGQGKRTCSDCQGHASTLTYLCLRVSRVFSSSTSWFHKTRDHRTGNFTTQSRDAISYGSRIPTRVIWEACEVDSTDHSELGSFPERIVVPQVFVPDSGSSEAVARIANVDMDDAIDDAVPARLAVGETEMIAEDGIMFHCGTQLEGGGVYAEKAVARRVRIRQGILWTVECEYGVPSSGEQKRFKVVFADRELKRDLDGEEDGDHRKWVVVHVDGYPMLSSYLKVGLYSLATAVAAGVLIGAFVWMKRRH